MRTTMPLLPNGFTHTNRAAPANSGAALIETTGPRGTCPAPFKPSLLPAFTLMNAGTDVPVGLRSPESCHTGLHMP